MTGPTPNNRKIMTTVVFESFAEHCATLTKQYDSYQIGHKIIRFSPSRHLIAIKQLLRSGNILGVTNDNFQIWRMVNDCRFIVCEWPRVLIKSEEHFRLAKQLILCNPSPEIMEIIKKLVKDCKRIEVESMQKSLEVAVDLVKKSSSTLRHLSCPVAVLDQIETNTLQLEELVVTPPLQNISYASAFAQNARRLAFHGFGFSFHALAYNFFVDNNRPLPILEELVFTDYRERWSFRVVRAAAVSLQRLPRLKKIKIGSYSFGRDELENRWMIVDPDDF